MSENELIDALENIMEAESDLRHEIERLNVIVRSHVLSNAKASGDECLQEKIVSSFRIGDFDSFEVDDSPLTKEELAKRKKNRDNFDFTNGVEGHDEKLDFNKLVDRYYARKGLDFEVGEFVELSDKRLGEEELAKKKEQRADINFNIGNESIEVNDRALSPETIKDKENARKKFSFRIERNNSTEADDDSIEVKDSPLSKEELEKRNKARKNIDFNVDDSVEVEDKKISEEKLKEKKKQRDSFDFSLGVETNDKKLSKEELEKREENRKQIKDSLYLHE